MTRHGRAAVVTGAAGDIGRAVVAKLVAEGCRVLAVDLDGAAVRDAFDGEPESIRLLEADVATEEGCARMVQAAVSQFDGIDVVHANAGVYGPFAALADSDPGTVRHVLDTNVLSVYHTLRAALPVMAANGGGSIVTTASTAGMRASRIGAGVYAASKAAVISLTQTAAVEAGPLGIRVNAISPGLVASRMTRQGLGALDDGGAAVLAALPLSRVADPAEVADVVAWLLSDEAGYVSGAVYPVEGGMFA